MQSSSTKTHGLWTLRLLPQREVYAKNKGFCSFYNEKSQTKKKQGQGATTKRRAGTVVVWARHVCDELSRLCCDANIMGIDWLVSWGGGGFLVEGGGILFGAATELFADPA